MFTTDDIRSMPQEAKDLGAFAVLVLVESLAEHGEPLIVDLDTQVNTTVFAEYCVEEGLLQKGPGGVPGGAEGYEMTEAGAKWFYAYREKHHGQF